MTFDLSYMHQSIQGRAVDRYGGVSHKPGSEPPKRVKGEKLKFTRKQTFAHAIQISFATHFYYLYAVIMTMTYTSVYMYAGVLVYDEMSTIVQYQQIYLSITFSQTYCATL